MCEEIIQKSTSPELIVAALEFISVERDALAEEELRKKNPKIDELLSRVPKFMFRLFLHPEKKVRKTTMRYLSKKDDHRLPAIVSLTSLKSKLGMTILNRLRKL